MSADRELIDEQIAYYRARAGEYDATSPIDGDPFVQHTDMVRAAIHDLGRRERVLELAAGTGQWTPQLAEQAGALLVTDSSPEMLDLNRAKTGPRDNVKYAIADALDMPPTHDRDLVFFGMFLSHVPPSRFEAFWDVLAGLLAPDGIAFVVDEADHGLWEEDWVDREAGLIHRTLNDGTVHRAVKVLWQPDQLAQQLAALGWEASLTGSGPFYWGIAGRR